MTGIRSGVLSRLDRSSMELIVRRAFTSVQLRTIPGENYHPFLMEHRPNERARDMAGRVAQAMKQASREATRSFIRNILSVAISLVAIEFFRIYASGKLG